MSDIACAGPSAGTFATTSTATAPQQQPHGSHQQPHGSHQQQHQPPPPHQPSSSFTKPPRNKSANRQHEGLYPHNKMTTGSSSKTMTTTFDEEMDSTTLATASTTAATSYSMTDDASEASEVGMEVVMSSSSTIAAPSPALGTIRPFQSHSFKAGKETFTLDTRYQFMRTIGSGAYGVVISASDSSATTTANNNVAIKMVPRAFNDEIDAKRILREIKLLKHFEHENIVNITDMMPPQHEYLDDFHDIYIVTDLMETDLHRIIYSKQPLSMDHVQYFCYQLLRGLKYIHSANVIHRDLKPSNLLVNSNCDLKICDFGLARGIGSTSAQSKPLLLTEYVVTRWYRAPEIMLACHEYAKPVDLWAVGCIFAELILRKPMFPGDDYIDQLTIICEKLGKLPESDLDFVTSDKAKRFLRKLPETVPVSLARQFPGASREALDLLRKMLQIHPRKRITVDEALAHPFFAQLHNPSDEPSSQKIFDFSFEQEKLDRLRLKELIWMEVTDFRPSSIPAAPRNNSNMEFHEA